MRDFIQALPRAELHVHPEGSPGSGHTRECLDLVGVDHSDHGVKAFTVSRLLEAERAAHLARVDTAQPGAAAH